MPMILRRRNVGRVAVAGMVFIQSCLLDIAGARYAAGVGACMLLVASDGVLARHWSPPQMDESNQPLLRGVPWSAGAESTEVGQQSHPHHDRVTGTPTPC